MLKFDLVIDIRDEPAQLAWLGLKRMKKYEIESSKKCGNWLEKCRINFLTRKLGNLGNYRVSQGDSFFNFSIRFHVCFEI